jgi:hypothetical protein
MYFSPYPGTEIYDQMNYHFSKDEYGQLFNASNLIQLQPHKYRFSQHTIDILSWANQQNHQFNRIWPNLKFHLSYKYFYTLFHSSQKYNYFQHFLI